MKNKALISLSFLVLFGVSACSTSSQKTPAPSTGNSAQPGGSDSSSIRPTNSGGSSYATNQQQNFVANQNEQKRLAYNYAWQKKQQQSRNKNNNAITDVQARRIWQQKQTQLLNQERGRASQQKRSSHQQRFAQQQKILAKEYAAQQRRAKYNAAKKVLSPAQKYAAQQMKKQAQLNSHRQSKAQQYAAQQMRKQAQLNAQRQKRAQQYAARQMQKPKQTQQYAAQQQRQTFQYQAKQPRQAVQYAAVQPRQVQQYALQQRNTQQYSLQQRNAQQYAAQQRNAQQYAAQQRQTQQRTQQQTLRLQQQNQQAQYLALLQPQQPNRTPRTPPQSNIGGLSSTEIRTIGDKIFRNESGGEIDKLVHWNVGENFASMGIGHFTWYPSGRRTRYGNTFPGLLNHLESNGVRLPAWVQKAKFSGAPWRTKGELLQAKRSPRLRQFQNLLYETRYLQAGYIVERAKRAMPRLVKATPQHLKAHVSQNLNAVANTPGGWYALIDYVNFKGEGLNRRGGYKGQNWGLLQVLENMRPSQPGPMALNNFADSAIQTLERRIRNSNPSRGESRWMRGWAVRCNTYRQPFAI